MKGYLFIEENVYCWCAIYAWLLAVMWSTWLPPYHCRQSTHECCSTDREMFGTCGTLQYVPKFYWRFLFLSILMQNHLYAEYTQILGFFIVYCTNCFGQKYYFVNAFATLSLQKVEAGLLRSFRKGAVLKQKRDSEPPFSRKWIWGQ